MNTLEEAQTHFQSKGYDTEIYTFKLEPLNRVESPLIIRGQKMPPIPNTNEAYYRVQIEILFDKGKWKVQRPWFQPSVWFNKLVEAISFAEETLVSPIYRGGWTSSMRTIEEAKDYFDAKGYGTEFLPPTSKRLLIHGLQVLHASHPDGFYFRSAILITGNEGVGLQIDRLFAFPLRMSN